MSAVYALVRECLVSYSVSLGSVEVKMALGQGLLLLRRCSPLSSSINAQYNLLCLSSLGGGGIMDI
jgi:hypothetical protein